MSSEPVYILRCQSPDAIGILARVTGFLAERRLSIVESHDFADPDTSTFFIRIAFNGLANEGALENFKADFEAAAHDFAMEWSVRAAGDKPKATILVSKGDHCLNDLLYRHRRGKLGVDIQAIASNHENLRWLAERHDISFMHIPVTKDTKPEAEAQLLKLVQSTRSELVVLARYMQILSDDLTRMLSGRCINIHHSFLPSFKGAKPYHQAHARGVKLIGATAHFVTADLDEGPIIAQDVIPIDHRKSANQLAEIGRDIEARVLSRAVTAYGEGRIFLNGHRTIVFD